MRSALLVLLLSFSVSAAPVVVSYSLLERQSVSTGWSTILNFETTIIDSHSAVIAPATGWKFVCPTGQSGPYFVSFYAQWAGPVSSVNYVYLRVNGIIFRTLARAENTPGSLGLNGSTVVQLNEGDALDVQILQASGQTKEISAGHISVFKITGT